MWIIFIVTILSFFIFVVFKVLIEERIKAKWLKITIEAFIIFLFIPLCFYFIASHVQDNKSKKVQAKNEEFTLCRIIDQTVSNRQTLCHMGSQ